MFPQTRRQSSQGRHTLAAVMDSNVPAVDRGRSRSGGPGGGKTAIRSRPRRAGSGGTGTGWRPSLVPPHAQWRGGRAGRRVDLDFARAVIGLANEHGLGLIDTGMDFISRDPIGGPPIAAVEHERLARLRHYRMAKIGPAGLSSMSAEEVLDSLGERSGVVDLRSCLQDTRRWSRLPPPRSARSSAYVTRGRTCVSMAAMIASPLPSPLASMFASGSRSPPSVRPRKASRSEPPTGTSARWPLCSPYHSGVAALQIRAGTTRRSGLGDPDDEDGGRSQGRNRHRRTTADVS